MQETTEKEIIASYGGIQLHFSYVDSRAGYGPWLNHGLRAIHDFLKENFSALPENISISLSVISDQEIQQINSEQRGKDKVTDVLSFPLQENVRKGEFESFHESLELGDILIAEGVCSEQAKDFSLDYYEEFIHLFAHGFLHLLGFDHEMSEDEDKLMRGHEERIVEAISRIKKTSM